MLTQSLQEEQYKSGRTPRISPFWSAGCSRKRDNSKEANRKRRTERGELKKTNIKHSNARWTFLSMNIAHLRVLASWFARWTSKRTAHIVSTRFRALRRLIGRLRNFLIGTLHCVDGAALLGLLEIVQKQPSLDGSRTSWKCSPNRRSFSERSILLRLKSHSMKILRHSNQSKKSKFNLLRCWILRLEALW